MECEEKHADFDADQNCDTRAMQEDISPSSYNDTTVLLPRSSVIYNILLYVDYFIICRLG